MLAALRILHAALGPDSGLVLAGGAVRDRLLGRPSGDWDLASALSPELATARAKGAGLRVIPTGLQHGTVTVMVEGQGFELTSFRDDGTYADGRRPESVRLGVSLEEDLSRRDFTINAMALPAEAVDEPDWRSRVVDPFGGQRDLADGLIRAVGDPLRRFQEDGLRPLRACRFAAQLGFRLDADTQSAIPQRLEIARQVSVERVLVEVTKLLCGVEPSRGMTLMADTGLLDLWLPDLRPMLGCTQNAHHAYDVWEHSLKTLTGLPAEPAFRWAGLLHDAGKPGTKVAHPDGDCHFHGHEAESLRLVEVILKRLRASHGLLGAVLALVRHHGVHPEAAWSDGACRRHLRRLAEDGLALEDWAAFRWADFQAKGREDGAWEAQHHVMLARLKSLAAEQPPLRARDLALDGHALMILAQRKGGPWLGELQAHLLEGVLESPGLNTAEGLKPLVESWLASNR